MSVLNTVVKWSKNLKEEGKNVEEEEEKQILISDSQDKVEILDFHSNTDSNRDTPEPYSDDKLGQNTRTPLFLYVVVFFSTIGGFLFGYDTTVISGALLDLKKDFSLSKLQIELVVSVTALAATVGALAGGLMNEKLGRKKTIIIASVIFAVGPIVMCGAPTNGKWSWLMVLSGRFIVGIAIGLASMTVPVYLAECSPAHLRGRLTMANVMALMAGQITAGIAAYGFSYISHGWRFMLGIAAFPAIVRFIAFFFLPESPRWLVGRGKVVQARSVLQKLRGRKVQVEGELGEIQKDMQCSAKENKQNVIHKLWTMLTTRHLLLALIVGCGLQGIKQLAGRNIVLYYTPSILQMAGVVDNHKAIGLGIIIALGNFIFTTIGLYCVEKLGRRKLVLSSLAGVIVSLFMLGIAFYMTNTHSPVTTRATPFLCNWTNYYNENNDKCKWKNCDDCVIDDDCHFCILNGSYGNSVSCVHTDSDFYSREKGACQVPVDLILNGTCTTDDIRTMIESVSSGMPPIFDLTTYDYCPSGFSWLTLAALGLFIIMMSLGLGPLPWTINTEIYPNWARSVGNSLSTTINWVGNLLTSVTFLHLTRYLSRYGSFWLYAGITILGWVFVFLFLPETKGRTLEQVEELFQRPLCPPLGLNTTGSSCSTGKRDENKLI